MQENKTKRVSISQSLIKLDPYVFVRVDGARTEGLHLSRMLGNLHDPWPEKTTANDREWCVETEAK